MGSIWVALHCELQTEVAIKFMNPAQASSPVLRARFAREAKAAARIYNRHVVHVQDYGVAEDDTSYLVMELLEGEDLGARLKRVRRLPPLTVAHIMSQIAKGLRKAHEAGIVHRDLKPSNIFLARIDDEEIVKVLDFGVAKLTSGVLLDESTKTGEIMGSPHYMSPEQVHESKNIDARSDLWSLGVILFRALTGELPFPGEACGLVMAKILTDPIPVPSQITSDLSPSFDAFFRRAFERDPAQRFQSVREMAAAFAEMVGLPRSTSPSWSFVTTTTVIRPAGSHFDSAPPASDTMLAPMLDWTPPSQRAPALRSDAIGDSTSKARTAATPSTPPSGTNLAAVLSAFNTAVPPRRRALLRWIGAGGLAGVVLGWSILASVVGGGAPSNPRALAAYPIAAAAAGLAPMAAKEAPAAPGKSLSDAIVTPAPEPIATTASVAAGPSTVSSAAGAAPVKTTPSGRSWASSGRKRPLLGF